MNGTTESFLEGNGIIIILLALAFFTGNGFGFGGNNGNGIQNAFENQNVINKLDTMATGLGNATWSLNDGLHVLGSKMDNCCCNNQKELLINRYEAQKNTCDIVNAIHNENEITRKSFGDAINQNLRDQLSQARDIISNTNQSRYILDQLGNYYTKPPCYPQYNPCGACGNLY